MLRGMVGNDAAGGQHIYNLGTEGRGHEAADSVGIGTAIRTKAIEGKAVLVLSIPSLLYNPSFFCGLSGCEAWQTFFLCNKTYRANEAYTSCADMQVKRL